MANQRNFAIPAQDVAVGRRRNKIDRNDPNRQWTAQPFLQLKPHFSFRTGVQSRIFVDSKLTWSCGKLFEESVSVQAVVDTVLRN